LLLFLISDAKVGIKTMHNPAFRKSVKVP
jgi:hypothetical protein